MAIVTINSTVTTKTIAYGIHDVPPTATPSLTEPAPTRTPAPENCYDCIDNDFDGFTDFGADPECTDFLDDNEAA